MTVTPKSASKVLCLSSFKRLSYPLDLGKSHFYSSFLGCEVPESASKTTRDYYQSTKEYINSADIDAETKIDLYNSLYTYLKVDQSIVLSIDHFATTYLEEDLRDDYTNYMISKGVPQGTIHKDLSYLTHALRRRKVYFSSAVQIIAPAENFQDLVSVIDSSDESTTVKIKGKVSSQE